MITSFPKTENEIMKEQEFGIGTEVHVSKIQNNDKLK